MEELWSLVIGVHFVFRGHLGLVVKAEWHSKVSFLHFSHIVSLGKSTDNVQMCSAFGKVCPQALPWIIWRLCPRPHQKLLDLLLRVGLLGLSLLIEKKTKGYTQAVNVTKTQIVIGHRTVIAVPDTDIDH